ncbi:MAG: hypothetical protein K8T89_00385, partial [Planctomycetes bacterium]|nr:hypothetical protein [Planctomycetota bacterium]
MRVLSIMFAVVVCTVGEAAAQPSILKTTQDTWETVFARDKEGRDQQIGYAHLTLEPFVDNGKNVIRATRELRITFKRDGQLAQLRADTGCEELEDGKVVGVFMRHWIGENQALSMEGQLDETGKKMNIKVKSTVKNEFAAPWDPKVIGLAAESSLLRSKMIKPGDSFTYRYFEATISSIATIKVEVKNIEEILLPRGGKKKLLRVESTPEKIQDVQLPASTIWVDPETREPVMTQIDMPDLGLLTLLRSTKEVASGPLGNVPDLMRLQTIRLGQ